MSNCLAAYNGGVRLFSGTHKYGIPITSVDVNGHYEVAGVGKSDLGAVLARHEYVDSESSLFEFYAVDSLLWHQSLRSQAFDSVRVTYIFRFSDIGNSCRLPYGLDTSKGASFRTLYSSLFIG